MDFVAQVLKSTLHPVDELVLAPLVHGRRTPLQVAFALAQQRVGQREELMGYRHNRFLHPPPRH